MFKTITFMTLAALAVATVAQAGPAPLTPLQQAIAADNPSLWYRFNEAPGSTTVLNHGSLGPTFNATLFNGAVTGAPTLDGDSGVNFAQPQQQYAQSGAVAPAQFLGNPSFTAEAVLRIDQSSGGGNYPPFLHWGPAQTGRSVFFSLHHNSNNKAYAGFYNGGMRQTGTFSNNCYHHIVWVRNSNGGTLGQHAGSTLYIDGQLAALEPDTTLIGAPVINIMATTFRVQRSTDANRYFTGTVDEVVLYDHVLTAEQVLAHYNAITLPVFVADLNDNCRVDGVDLGVLLAQWNTDGTADLNRDHVVNGIDLGILLANWTG